MHDLIVENARLYPMAPATEPATATSFAVDDGAISAIPAAGDAKTVFDAAGGVVMPGLIDCHTHALYAGNRMHEQAQRLQGRSYAEIAVAGGGIASTVRAVRAATQTQLVEETLPRLAALAGEGVTTVEIKSGYGLSPDAEIKMLEAIDTLRGHTAQRLQATFLGAHTVPAGTSKEKYIGELLGELLPAVVASELSDVCDIYIESIAFDTDDARRILGRACELGMQCRAHTDQLSNIGGTRLAALFGALSCDHLEHAGHADVDAMATAGTTAVLLPGAYYFLRETRRPPVGLLREHRVPIAVASDLNPGTSPVVSLLTAMHFATTLFGLTPEEVLLGVTANAARALGAGAYLGTLEVGNLADFCVWDIPAPEFLVYQLGGVRPAAVFIGGTRQ